MCNTPTKKRNCINIYTGVFTSVLLSIVLLYYYSLTVVKLGYNYEQFRQVSFNQIFVHSIGLALVIGIVFRRFILRNTRIIESAPNFRKYLQLMAKVLLMVFLINIIFSITTVQSLTYHCFSCIPRSAWLETIYLSTINSFLFCIFSYQIVLKTVVQELLEKRNSTSSNKEETIVLKSGKKFIRFDANSIVLIKAEGNYAKIQTIDGVMLIYASMKELENKLPKSKFIRVHRCFILALNYIESLDSKVVTVKSMKVPIGAKYQDNINNLKISYNERIA